VPGQAAEPARDRRSWTDDTQEARVERFYSHGAENIRDYHGGYLNFGLWEADVRDYVGAAERMVRRIAELMGLGPRSRLLDVACGTGSQDLYLCREFGVASIDGVDVTWAHVEHGRAQAAAAGLAERVRFHHGTAVALPFPDGSFTHVLGIEGPAHFATRQRFLEEAQRVLASGGVLGLTDYPLARHPRTLGEHALLGIARRLWHVPAANLWTSAEYRARLEAAGFAGVQIREVGGAVYPGYYREQARPEVKAELKKRRGFVAGRLGHVIDVVAYRAYTSGLAEYALIRAVKPGR
jgi:SAM-dependent methyltransferase